MTKERVRTQSTRYTVQRTQQQDQRTFQSTKNELQEERGGENEGFLNNKMKVGQRLPNPCFRCWWWFSTFLITNCDQHPPLPPLPLQLGLSSHIKTPTVLPSAVCLTQQSEQPPQPQLLYEVSPLLLLSFCWHKIDEQHGVNFRVTAQNFDYGVRIRLRTPSNKNTQQVPYKDFPIQEEGGGVQVLKSVPTHFYHM